jgi:hypothetical protein
MRHRQPGQVRQRGDVAGRLDARRAQAPGLDAVLREQPVHQDAQPSELELPALVRRHRLRVGLEHAPHLRAGRALLSRAIVHPRRDRVGRIGPAMIGHA